MNQLPLDRRQLIGYAALGDVFTYMPFFNGIYSQFYTSAFALGGLNYRWAEQWMMACKARLFHDSESLEQIMAANSPGRCKDLGRRVKNYDDDTWAKVRWACVVNGNFAKFDQDPNLRNHILRTGDSIFIEASPTDTVWGVGLGMEHPSVCDPQQWRGENLLGFALVYTRHIIREKDSCLPSSEAVTAKDS